MPTPRKRDVNGKFISEKYEEEELPSNVAVKYKGEIRVNHFTLMRVLLIMLVLLLSTPWMFVIVKKVSLPDMPGKISKFYNDNFGCPMEEVSKKLATEETTKPPKF